MFPLLLTLLSAVVTLASPSPPGMSHEKLTSKSFQPNPRTGPADSGAGAHCFPAIGFHTPSQVPESTDGWWCDPATEYAFLGFSYEVSACEYVVI